MILQAITDGIPTLRLTYRNYSVYKSYTNSRESFLVFLSDFPYNEKTSLPDGQSLALAGGKSGLHRAACRLTAGGIRSKRVSRKVPQKIYRRSHGG